MMRRDMDPAGWGARNFPSASRYYGIAQSSRRISACRARRRSNAPLCTPMRSGVFRRNPRPAVAAASRIAVAILQRGAA